MGDTAEYAIGAEVASSDGVCGELSRVVIDPVARVLTHLVVAPKNGSGFSRLVPIDLVEENAERIQLHCSTAEFDELEDAEETRFLSESDEQLGYGAGEMLAWPYYGLGMGAGVGAGIGGTGVEGNPPLIYDRVPAGEVEVRRGQYVHATDGHIGQIRGLVIDPKDHHVTHLLLQEGHLWGKKRVAIPIGVVKEVSADGVRLDLTRDQVRELPPVELGRHG
jgi:sporulation protein YlmC with PRC-barrel domain